jgi:hypothetical protein
MRALPLLLALTACADPLSAVAPASELDGARIDPPQTLSLDASYLFVGETVDVAIGGAPPGASVALFRGRDLSPGWCLSTPDPVCLDVADARFLGRGTADADGALTLTIPVPAGAPIGATMSLQALSWDGPTPMDGSAVSPVWSGELLDPAAPLTFSASDLSDCVTLDGTTGRAFTLTHGGSVVSAGFDAASVTSISGALIDHTTAAAVPGAVIVDLGGGAYELQADLMGVDFTVNNPWTFDAELEVVSDGLVFTATQHWSIAAVPERTAFMWMGTSFYAKTLPDVVFRPGNSLYLGYSNMYGPGSSPAPGVTEMTGPAAPVYDDINLLYFSVGDHYVTSMNEAYFYDFAPLDTASTAYSAGGCAPDGLVFFVPPSDLNGDGDIDWMDVDAIDLESL